MIDFLHHAFLRGHYGISGEHHRLGRGAGSVRTSDHHLTTVGFTDFPSTLPGLISPPKGDALAHREEHAMSKTQLVDTPKQHVIIMQIINVQYVQPVRERAEIAKPAPVRSTFGSALRRVFADMLLAAL